MPAAPSAGKDLPKPSLQGQSGHRRVLAGFIYSYQEDSYGRHWPLYEGENLVGRAETSVKCDVAIAHGTTSTRHAKIVCGAQVQVVDMKSTNGTYVNGKRIPPNAPQALSESDKLRFGGYTVQLVITRRS
jgi:pSer/pThr/pTyr-binding forkhead associated (FHA) protein